MGTPLLVLGLGLVGAGLGLSVWAREEVRERFEVADAVREERAAFDAAQAAARRQAEAAEVERQDALEARAVRETNEAAAAQARIEATRVPCPACKRTESELKVKSLKSRVLHLESLRASLLHRPSGGAKSGGGSTGPANDPLNSDFDLPGPPPVKPANAVIPRVGPLERELLAARAELETMAKEGSAPEVPEPIAPPPAPGPAQVRLGIEEALRRAVPGVATFSEPKELTVDEPTTVELVLAPKASGEEKANNAPAAGQGKLDLPRLTPAVEARLTAHPKDFDIVAQSSEKQLVSAGGARFRWSVTPKRAGGNLLMTYQVMAAAENSDVKLDLELREIRVSVRATPSSPWQSTQERLVKMATDHVFELAGAALVFLSTTLRGRLAAIARKAWNRLRGHVEPTAP